LFNILLALKFRTTIKLIFSENLLTENLPPLMPLVLSGESNHPNAICFTANNYLQLVDWAGRTVREGKHCAISSNTPSTLSTWV
jgi:hypothetical protein